MAETAKTDEGAARLARMNERVDRYVAEKVEEGDQHAPQGGIVGNAPHIVPLPEIVSRLHYEQHHLPPTLIHRLHRLRRRRPNRV